MSLDAMKLALEALEEIADEVFAPYDNKLGDAILALRAATEQAQRNEFNPDWDAMAVMVKEQQRIAKRIEELEAKPRQWQGLDDVEIVGTTCECVDDGTFNMDCAMDFARAIEAKLREKNT